MHSQKEVKMQLITRYGTIAVVIHAIVVALHGLAHEKIPVSLSLLQSLFVGSIIVLVWIAAMILLWTPLQQTGSWLLLSSMAGAILFGLYHHFIVISPDHVSQVPLQVKPSSTSQPYFISNRRT